MSEENKKNNRTSAREASLSAPAGSGWIACADRMPNDCLWYLIVLDNWTVRGTRDIGIGWRKKSSDGKFTGWWETNQGVTADIRITHWMPLPDLPNVELTRRMGASPFC